MTVVNIHDAKTHFSKLIDNLPPRQGGQLKGIMDTSEDFDAPLPEEVLKGFFGE